MSSNRYGIAWPVHSLTIEDKHIRDVSFVTHSLALPRGSGILIDVKDTTGRIFFPTTVKAYKSQRYDVGFNGFHESIYYAEREGHELFLGLPVLRDSSPAARRAAMVSASGIPHPHLICPMHELTQELATDLVGDLAVLAPSANLFLPFFRYPVERKINLDSRHMGIQQEEAFCFCSFCRKGFNARYGYPLSWDRITQSAKTFFDWLQWRCFTIEILSDLLLKHAGRERLVLEVDLCPKRHFMDGPFLDNGHDIPALSKKFKKILIHAFDRSMPPSPMVRPGTDTASDIMLMTVERLKREATVFLLFWQIQTEQSLEAAYNFANLLDAEISFFVLHPPIYPALCRRFAGGK